MQTATNRTFICSIVFLDIVGYSKKPVTEQIQLKERLNTLLTEALENVAVNDRIILDTGDGAALSFLGDPEDALFASLMLRDANATPGQQGAALTMRIGINLGPVKLVKDINGQPNIIGDGINVAQRVMSFSEPGQVLVSRSYYEVVSRMSDDYIRLFHFEGSRTDKHVREHEVYAVRANDEALKRVTDAAPRRRKDDTQTGPVVFDMLSQSAAFVTDNIRRKPLLGTALAVTAILAVAVGLRMGRKPPAAPVALTESPPPKVATAPITAPVKEAPRASLPDKPVAAAPKVAPAPVPPKAKPAPVPPKAKPAPASPKAAASASGSVTVGFIVLPWGEVFINGKRHGVAPPLKEVTLSPGRYKIEIKNGEFEPHVQVVDVTPGSSIRIRHRFR
ncbi:MAG TPA: adenylate/guanylate cyclase domain-containing protein [Burkholderiales bacterium]|nr:adenylate/guanylate cyclase domain-containing protein [Burkholderiales bacterium]